MIGKTVWYAKLPQFRGVVKAKHTIRISGVKTTVYAVKWDAEDLGNSQPMTWKDEDGSKKAGYRAEELRQMDRVPRNI